MYLVGDGAHFHRHASLPGQKFCERMSRQGKPMADTRRIHQQSIQHVLIHICTLQVFVTEHTSKNTVISSFYSKMTLSTSSTSKLTSFPSMEIEGKGHPLLCWQRQGLSEVPQWFAAIFTAHLYVKKQQAKPNKFSVLPQQNVVSTLSAAQHMLKGGSHLLVSSHHIKPSHDIWEVPL